MQTWNKYKNSNKKLLDIWADEYYIQKQKLAKDQEVLSDKKLYDNIMEQKADGFCNIIYNVIHELKSKEIHFMFMGFRLKDSVFKKYYDQIIIENYGAYFKYKNSIDIMEQYLKDNPRHDNMLTKNENSLSEGFGLYADYFIVRCCGCLITGSGKTHTLRGVYKSEEVSLDLIYLNIKENAVFYGDIKTDYFINLISDNEINPDGVKEVSSDVYLKYAKGNFEVCMNYEVASAIIDACSKRNIVFIIVPWMESMEDRINAINTYFEYRFN